MLCEIPEPLVVHKVFAFYFLFEADLDFECLKTNILFDSNILNF